MDLPEIVADMVPHAKVAASAFAGGLVRLFLRPAASLMQTFMLLISCVTCGYFGQPAVSYMLGLPERFDGAVGALMGLIGVSLANGALKAADRFDFNAWIARGKSE